MFDITKLILKIPNFLTHEECDGLIEEFEQRKEESFLEQSVNYKTNRIEKSSFKVVPLIPNTFNFNLIRSKTKEAVSRYINYLDQPKYFFTKHLKRQLKFSHSYRIMKYAEGAEIHPHSDHDPGIYGSVSFNLSNGYEGGEFKFFNGNHTVSLNKGDALLFPADYFWVHEVTPVTKGARYSLNSFLCQSPYEILQHSRYLHELLHNDHIHKTNPEELLGPYN